MRTGSSVKPGMHLIAHVDGGAGRDRRIAIAALLVEDRPRLVEPRERRPDVVVGRERRVSSCSSTGSSS